MAYSISSKEKLTFLSDTLDLIRKSRVTLSTAMGDCLHVADQVAMAGTDRVYNGMANIATGMNDLLDKTRDAFGGAAETLTRGAENIGPEFASRIKVLADEYAALPTGETFGVKKESTGLDDNMTPELSKKLEESILAVIEVRKDYVLNLADLASKAMSDPDFKEVIVKVGKASEDFGNDVLLASYNSIADQLHALGIFLDKRMEELREHSNKVNAASMPSGKAGALDV